MISKVFLMVCDNCEAIDFDLADCDLHVIRCQSKRAGWNVSYERQFCPDCAKKINEKKESNTK